MRRGVLLFGGALVLVLATWWPTAAAVAPRAVPTLIVEYSPDALRTVGVATADIGAAEATAAVATAQSWGASEGKQAAIAATASATAAAAPAVAAVSASVASSAVQHGIRLVSQTNYATVLHGAAFRTRSAADARRLQRQLQRNPSVARVWYAQTRSLVAPVVAPPGGGANGVAGAEEATPPQYAAAAPLTATSGNQEATGLGRTGAGVNGTGVLVCVIDTGINYKLDVFGGCTGINAPQGRCRVVTGYNFVGDAYNGTTSGAPATRGGEPLDCMGHGTMVASVAATSNGVAPGALLGSYRVFGCDGYVTDDIIIEAIDRAVTDGCDVINLSLSSGSGYAEHSVFKPVMDAALAKGVLVVKAAGNAGREGPFTADVATAVGAVSVASAGADSAEPLDSRLAMSGFSSYGPAATLELSPHVSAPGAFISVKTMYGKTTRSSGTSFASPYVAGVLALWLQHQTAAAVASGKPLEPGTARQDAALRGLVATAKGVPDASNARFLEPVAKMGAGLMQVDALLHNQLAVSPMMVHLPSSATNHTTSLSVSWKGRATADSAVTYELVHRPSAAMTVSDGWYGTSASIKRVYEAAEVTFDPPLVTISTNSSTPVSVSVTFTVPATLSSRPLLYSGLVQLQPRAPAGTSTAVHLPLPPPVVVPYEGFSQQWSALRLPARVDRQLSTWLADFLASRQNALCYAPRSRPVFVNSVMDAQAAVPEVCSGGMASNDSQPPLNVSLAVLKASPECSLRITLVPEVPINTVYVHVLSTDGELLGSLEPLDVSSGSSISTQGEVWSTCLHWNGAFKDVLGRPRVLEVGSTYKLRAFMQGPVAAGDIGRNVQPGKAQVDIGGTFKVTE